MEKKIVSVADFAKTANMPKAEVYRIAGNRAYKDYVSTVNGIKMIDLRLLDVLRGEVPRNDKPIAEEKEEVAETLDNERIISSLTADLAEARKEIDRLNAQIQDLSLRLAEMAVRSQEITEKALNTVNQQQILTAITTKKLPWYKRFLAIGKNE